MCLCGHRASVQGSTRFVQMMMVGVAVQAGSSLFGSIGQGWTATIGAAVIGVCVGLGLTVPPLGQQRPKAASGGGGGSVYQQVSTKEEEA